MTITSTTTFGIGVLALVAVAPVASKKVSGTLDCEMADFFDEGFALHACFISAEIVTANGQDAVERIPVRTSEEVVIQASAMNGFDYEFNIEEEPDVGKLDTTQDTASGTFGGGGSSNGTIAAGMFATGQVSELTANSFGYDRSSSFVIHGKGRRLRRSRSRSRRLTSRTYGDKTILVLRLDLEDVHPTFTEQALTDMMWGAGCTEQDCTSPSLEQAFARAGNGEYRHTFPEEGISTVLTINIKKNAADYDDSYCNYRDIREDALAQMAIDFPDIPSRTSFDNLLMHVSSGQMTSPCRWGGVAAGADSWVFSGSTPNLGTSVHEVGHNVGMTHAASGNVAIGQGHVEYGDRTDVMGSGAASRFNMPHALYQGWIRQETVGWYNKDFEADRIWSTDADKKAELANVVDIGVESWTLRPQEERTATDGSVTGVRVRTCVSNSDAVPEARYGVDGYYYLATSRTFSGVAVYLCPSQWGEPDVNQDRSSAHCVKTWHLATVGPSSQGYVPHLCANGETGCGLSFDVSAEQTDGRVHVAVNGRCMAKPGPDIPNGCACGGGDVGTYYDGECKGPPPIDPSTCPFSQADLDAEDALGTSISDGYWTCETIIGWQGDAVCADSTNKHYDWGLKCPAHCAKQLYYCNDTPHDESVLSFCQLDSRCNAENVCEPKSTPPPPTPAPPTPAPTPAPPTPAPPTPAPPTPSPPPPEWTGCSTSAANTGTSRADPCMAHGASNQQAYCVYGDHCACTDGFVCDDGKSQEGECESGTGTTVHCINKEQCMGDYDATDAYPVGPRKTNCGGSTGNGCMDYLGGFDSLTWSTVACQAGSYIAVIRYALSAGDRPQRVTVNGVDIVASQSFPGTGGWDKWGTVDVAVTLAAGINTIKLTGTGSSGGNFDKMTLITDPSATPVPTPVPTTPTPAPEDCKAEKNELQVRIDAEKSKTAVLQRELQLMAAKLQAASTCRAAPLASECDGFGC